MCTSARTPRVLVEVSSDWRKVLFDRSGVRFLSVIFRKVVVMDAAEVGVGARTAVDLALAAHEASLDHLIKLVEDGGLESYDDLGFVAVMQHFERVRNRHALVDHRCVRDGKTRALPERLAQRSMTVVLAGALRISHAEAARRVRAADQIGEQATMTGQPLPTLRPALAEAQRAGEASPEQVDIVLRALAKVDHRGFDPADLDAGEQLLAAHTATLGPEDLRELAARVIDRIDPDGTRPQDDLNADRRHFAFRKTQDGMFAVEGRLTGAVGAKLNAVLGPLAAPRVGSVTLEDGREVESGDPRHHGQRMHDALEEACDRLLRSPSLPDSGGTPATVIVTIGLDDLEARTGAGLTSDGTRLGVEEIIAHLAGQALIHPTVIDAQGQVLWMGRTSRLATTAQTKALLVRDGGCSFPGCQRPPEHCERHHIVAWIDGGLTDLDNLTLLCRFHHHQFLARGWTCRLIDGLPAWTPPRWIDPHQRPQVNARIVARHLRC